MTLIIFVPLPTRFFFLLFQTDS